MSTTNIEAALHDVLFRPDLDLQEAIDRHFSPEYRQRTDGQWTNRAEFVEHMAHLRSVVASGGLEVHEELTQGNLYADRHTVSVVKTDGTTVRTEVYLFAEFAPDGRFLRVEETTLMLEGHERDRNLGSAR
ncbi:nuclear transport factor 2 family protein [Pendulispora rubella]|uniref:Nuclear transport factor 2 family protein n=1 Tax=Pendulispora rubella TaxID=2741070 RepID=A0ABZ2LIJ2_9BACT